MTEVSERTDLKTAKELHRKWVSAIRCSYMRETKGPLQVQRPAFAWTAAQKGDLPKGESLVQDGLRELPNEPQFAPERVFCLLRAAELSGSNKKAASQEELDRVRAAQQMSKTSPAKSQLDEMGILTDLAGAYGDNGQFRESNAAFEQASVLMTNLGIDQTRKGLNLLNDWVFTLDRAGRPLEAERAYRRAMGISRTNQTEDAVAPTVIDREGWSSYETSRLASSVQ